MVMMTRKYAFKGPLPKGKAFPCEHIDRGFSNKYTGTSKTVNLGNFYAHLLSCKGLSNGKAVV